MGSDQPVLAGAIGELHWQWRRLLWVVLGYAVLSVVFTQPLAWKTGDGYVANLAANADGSYLFNPYHLKKCLSEGTNCTHTDLQCFPIGNSLALNTNMPVPSLMAQLWANTTQGLNVVLLLNCLLMAFGGYLFARLWVRSDVLAFVAGALFAFWMGRSAHLWYGHANLMFAAPLPFALFALHRVLPNALAQKHPLEGFRVSWAGLFLCLTALTALHDLILAGFIAIYAVLLSILLVYRLTLSQRKWYVQVLVLVGLCLVVDQWTQWMLKWGFEDNGAYYFSGSIKNLFYPHPVSAFYAQFKYDADIGAETRSGFDMGRVMFFGIAFWLLGAGIFVTRLVRRQGLALPWMFVLLTLGVLYTMPLIRWGNGRWLYGPFSVTHFIPMWNENRCPTRFADVLMLLGPVWCMVNLEQTKLWERLRAPLRTLVGVALALVLLAEHVPQRFFFVDFDDRPAVYTALQQSPEPSAMFVPFGLVDGKKSFGKMWLEPFAYQPQHGRKMHNGFLSRIDDASYALFEKDSFVLRMVRNEWFENDCSNPDYYYDSIIYAAPDSVTTLASLRKLQLRQLVVNDEVRHDAVTTYLETSLRPFIVKDTTFAEGHRWILLDW